MPTQITRRRVLAGISLAAIAGTQRFAFAAGGDEAGRLFTIEDAFRRSEIVGAVAAPAGNQWAITITRPMTAPGLYGDTRGAMHPRAQIWLADAQLGKVQRISRDAAPGGQAWESSPSYAPGGGSLAFLICEDAATPHLAVRTAGGEIKRFAAAPPVALAVTTNDDDRPFLWLDDNTLLYVALRGGSYTAYTVPGSEPVVRNAAWRTDRAGNGTTVRVWNEASPTCGASNALVRLDVRSGKVTTVFDGDVRAVSVAPDRKNAAFLVAAGHLDIPAIGAMPRSVHPMIIDERLVQVALYSADLRSNAARKVEEYNSAGSTSARELPVWSADSTRFAAICRDAFDEEKATYAVIEVPARGAAVRHTATSQLDAEVVANLVALAVTDGERQDRLARRPHLTATVLNAIGATDNVCRFGKGELYAFDGAVAHHLAPATDRIIAAAPQTPTLLRDGRLLALGVERDVRMRWTYGAGGMVRETLSMPVQDMKLLGVDGAGNALFVETADAGTFFWTVHETTARKASFALNRHLADIRQPRVVEAPYKNVQGEDRHGFLALPPQHHAGQRHPVVMWAYPDYKPGLRRPLFRTNDISTYYYPFQLLLAAGFAVFWADFPTKPFLSESGQERVEPYQHILDELNPAIAMLQSHPDIAPNQVGFYGHSNAGFVALTLAAHTHELKAIVAYSTFPDWVAVDMRAGMQLGNACGAFDNQGERFYAESRVTPYGLGVPFWAAPDKYIRNSSLFHLHKATTPVLFIQGELDATPIPIEESYAVLQANGVPSELAFYRNETHSLHSPGNIRDAFTRTVGWFEKYLKV